MKFSAIAQSIGITEASSLSAFPERDPDIVGVDAVQTATVGSVSYIEGEKFSQYVATTQASALILPPNELLQAQADERGLPWLSARDPRLAFARTIGLFYRPFQPQPGIHPTAIIDPTVKLGAAVAIGGARRRADRSQVRGWRVHSPQCGGLSRGGDWRSHRAPRQLCDSRTHPNWSRLRHS